MVRTDSDQKGAGFKGIVSLLRPIREWLKNSPPIDARNIHHPHYKTTHSASTSAINKGHQRPPAVSRTPTIVMPPVTRTPPIVMPPVTQTPPNVMNPAPTPTPQLDQFRRSARARMSLPIMHHQNELRRQAYSQAIQLRLQPQQHLSNQSLGHIYLQHVGETKQANLPNELTAIDTIRALFVCAFPNILTMKYMSEPHVKIYIYNPSCNIFYELHDIRDVRHESVLRIHHSDPLTSICTPSQYAEYAQRLGQKPPPKPRRMIPVNGMSQTSLHQHLQHHQQQQHQHQHYASITNAAPIDREPTYSVEMSRNPYAFY